MININKTIEENRIKEKLKFKTKKKSKSGGKVNVIQSQFMDKLLEIQQVESINEELNTILADLDKEGKNFSKNPNMETLKKYKTLVKSFMDTVINKMYKLKEEYKYRYKTKQKQIFIIVETINKKLEKLTNFVIDKEKENINLLSTLDEIRGLLLDLYK